MTLAPSTRTGGALAPPIPEHVAAGDESQFIAFCLEWRRRTLSGIEIWNDHELVHGWLTECSPTGSDQTPLAYRRHIERFRTFLRGWYELPPLEQTGERLLAPGSPEAITVFAGALRNSTMAKSSYNCCIAAVSSFYKWCSDSTRRGFTGIPVTPMPSGLQLRKTMRKARSLTHEQMAMIQVTARSRDGLVVKMLYLLGVRATEAICIRWDDIERIDGGAVVHIRKGKGSKPRSIPVKAHVVGVLDQLRAAQPDSPWVLPNPTDPRRHMSRQGLWKLTRRVGDAAGVPGAFPHSFRHSHATHAWAATKDSKLVQQTLGHSDISTTMNLYVDETAGDSSANYLS